MSYDFIKHCLEIFANIFWIILAGWICHFAGGLQFLVEICVLQEGVL